MRRRHRQETVKAKNANVDNLPKNSMKRSTKRLQKIAQVSNYIFDSKNQKSTHTNKQLIAHNGHADTM